MKKKTSVFRGVRYDPKRKRWMVQVRPASFHQQYPSEMEAAAHYAAVAICQWPEGNSTDRLLEVNSPWKGRPEPPRAWNQHGQRLLDIDHNYAAIVDEQFYQQFKDDYWFIRKIEGRDHALVIHAVEKIDQRPWFRFSYIPMENLVFGGPCVHVNGKPLDNRRSNLVAPGQPVSTGSIRPLSPEYIRSRARGVDPLREEFRRELERWNDYKREMEGDEERVRKGKKPQNPQTNPKYKQYWEEDL